MGLGPGDVGIEGWTVCYPGVMESGRSSPDAVLKNKKKVCLEFKRHRYEMLEDYGDQLTNEVPPMEYDQVQWHMHHSGCEVCFVGVFFKGSDEMRWWRVERDEERIKEIDEAAFQFFVGNIQARKEPPVDPTPGCINRLKKLEEKEASRRTFNNTDWQIAMEYDRICKGIKEMEAAKKAAEAKLREAIGEMQELYLEDGKSKVTCKAPKGRDTRTLRVSIKD